MTGKKNGNKSGSVRDRVKGLAKKGDANGAESNRLKLVEGGEAPAEAKPSDGRIPAKLDDYYAAMLHTANNKILELRKQLFNQQKQLVERDNRMLEKDKTIHDLEQQMLETENAKLRQKHALVVNQTIVSDDATGEVYRVALPQQQA